MTLRVYLRMKSNLNLSIDTDVIEEAKKRIPNISSVVEDFLKNIIQTIKTNSDSTIEIGGTENDRRKI